VKALINVTVYDYYTYHPSSYVVFDKKIIEIGKMEDFNFEKATIIDGDGMLLLPGLINFHTHIYSTLIRGLDMGATPETFMDVLTQIWWRFDQALTLDDLYISGLVYGQSSIKCGVTALIDHNASGAIKGSIRTLRNAVKETLGMKGLFCFETSDRFNVAECIEENLTAIESGDSLFGLHASLSLSDKTMNRIEPVIGSVPIHVHVAESAMDEAHALETYGMSVVHRLGRFNLLNEGSLLAHCVHVDEEEAELIGKSKCSVAINPTSNMNNAVGSFNYKLLRDNDIQLVVGTDGLGCNVAKEWQNLYYVGKNTMNEPAGIALDDIKTYLGQSYEYFNQLSGERLGRIEKGYAADFMLVDYQPPTPINEKNIFAHVFYGIFDQLNPKNVYISGDEKLSDYKLTQEFQTDMGEVNALWERVRKRDGFTY